MNRLTLIGALAFIVLAIAVGLIWVMDKQENEEVASQTAPETQSSAQSQSADTKAPETEQAILPSFDIVRVNPTGDAVIAGRAKSEDVVTILDNGEILGSATADNRGEWVFLPKSALDPGEHRLSLEAIGKDGGEKLKSEKEVVVVVPEIARDLAGNPTENPAGALAIEVPTQGTGAVRILNLPGQASANQPAGGLSISAVDYGRDGKTTFAGRAPAQARLIAYLNNQPVAEVTADDKGSWSFDQASPVGTGPHNFRVDQIDDQGKVVARAEIVFEFIPETKVAALPEEGKGSVVIVKPGQNLWLLARRTYGEGIRYTLIFDANRSQITNPDLIFPGQVLQLPQNQ